MSLATVRLRKRRTPCAEDHDGGSRLCLRFSRNEAFEEPGRMEPWSCVRHHKPAQHIDGPGTDCLSGDVLAPNQCTCNVQSSSMPSSMRMPSNHGQIVLHSDQNVSARHWRVPSICTCRTQEAQYAEGPQDIKAYPGPLNMTNHDCT